MEKIKINNYSFAYPEQEKYALENISFTVEKGEFVVVCGKSGCGKSTLLRQLKSAIAPHGVRNGDILFEGISLESLDIKKQAAEIGFVQQSPENQIVTDKVWHELAFGLESMGEDTQTIRRKVAEMASFFGIQEWFNKRTSELSGGQKQLLNLASVMVMQPSVLILDEPTSQLDPIAASDFLTTIGKINRELGVTVIITEHRLEEVFSFADKTVCLDEGKLFFVGSPRELGQKLKIAENPMFSAMPAAMRIWSAIENDGECPLTVCEGSRFISRFAEKHSVCQIAETHENSGFGDVMISADKVWFRYEKNGEDIVKGLELSVRRGEFFALLGGNGTGKTTSLKLLAGLEKPYRGDVRKYGKIALLPQNPQSLFVKKTVVEDLFEIFGKTAKKSDEQYETVMKTAKLCHIDKLLDRHPYDLSGGEQQRTALAKILLCDPEILLLDEPTKGMDAQFKEEFAEILGNILADGKAVFMVSHDIEFCAEYADRCAMFFDGAVTSVGSPREFFSGNSFYTTSANRMARHILPNAVTVNDVVKACGGKEEKHRILRENSAYSAVKEVEEKQRKNIRLPLWRKITAAFFGLIALAVFIYSAKVTDLTKIVTAEGLSSLAGKQMWLYAVLILSLFLSAFSIGRRSEVPVSVQTKKAERRLSRRTAASAAMILLAVPFTLFIGIFYLGGKRYNITAFAVLIECMLPFFMVFEKKRPQARELAVIASLCAVGIAGRAVFFMLPEFKPVMAVTIISGVAFGGETGFLVGAVTMLASNFMFSQGPWTPWQMFAMGITGFLAGVLFKKGLLRRTRGSLAVFGAISAIVIYGGIVNPAAAIIWSSEKLSQEILISYYITGFPMDCVHAFATAFFLFTAAEPMLEKLDRIKTKYGLIS